MRLIDADKLIKDLSDLKKSPWANMPYLSADRKFGISEALDMIESIVRCDKPTVDAVPVRHGKWIIEDGHVCCSECGEISKEYNWCPYCGARMDEEKEE